MPDPSSAPDDQFFAPACRQLYQALNDADALAQQNPAVGAALSRVNDAIAKARLEPDINLARCALASLHGALTVANPTLIAIESLYQFALWPDDQLRGLVRGTLDGIIWAMAERKPVPFEVP